jgi:DNA-binding response OmpR family regulator
MIPLDIAILDVNMPQMDEAALAKEIRKRWMDTPTLMLTSMGQRPIDAGGPGAPALRCDPQ